MAKKVEGELYESITGQLFEIGRQLRQKGGYPFNPEELKIYIFRMRLKEGLIKPQLLIISPSGKPSNSVSTSRPMNTARLSRQTD